MSWEAKVLREAHPCPPGGGRGNKAGGSFFVGGF